MQAQTQNPIAVIGAGAWGTALAVLLAQKGHAIRLWEYNAEYAKVLETTRQNPKFLPGLSIPEQISITSVLDQAVADCSTLVMVVPSQVFRSVIKQIVACQAKPKILISASKGIECDTLCRMSEIVVQEFLPASDFCVLSGPSHAEEVSRGIPTSVVAASASRDTAGIVQELFMTESFRVYSSTDVAGVELGGSLKNIIAIAAGVVDGLGLGDNTKAALITRGLAEMSRLGIALQAQAETFAGLSGMGDLVVTCTSRHSRNRRVGEELGRGRKIDEILNEMEMVAEGVETTRSAKKLADAKQVEMPITTQMSRILFERLDPHIAVKALMQRSRKAENETREWSESEGSK
ncbi:NAD(P)H-dependent glycerol-3-phosphate dehydrogenase [bacterium]|nr:NAD(P)H-dependent glycerol-3-phosphate dehydrogenase [bacterium]